MVWIVFIVVLFILLYVVGGFITNSKKKKHGATVLKGLVIWSLSEVFELTGDIVHRKVKFFETTDRVCDSSLKNEDYIVKTRLEVQGTALIVNVRVEYDSGGVLKERDVYRMPAVPDEKILMAFISNVINRTGVKYR